MVQGEYSQVVQGEYFLDRQRKNKIALGENMINVICAVRDLTTCGGAVVPWCWRRTRSTPAEAEPASVQEKPPTPFLPKLAL